MKKFLSMFLALIVILSAVAMFVACDGGNDKDKDDKKDDKTEATTTVATTTEATTVAATTAAPAPLIPADYKVYENDDLSFAYPKSWISDESTGMLLIQDAATGNNITLAAEPKTDSYDNLTVEKYKSEYVPVLEEMGITISNVTIKYDDINGIKTLVLTQTASYTGISMNQTQYTFTVGDSTYSLTVTEATAVPGLAANVFNSIGIK